MKRLQWAIPLLLLLAACGTNTPDRIITILDDEHVHTLAARNAVPADLLAEAGLHLAPADRVLANGLPISPDSPLACRDCTLQIRRAVPITLVTPDGEQTFESAAFTLGEALDAFGLELHAADFLDPPAETPLTAPLTVTYRPARDLSIQVGGRVVHVRSAAETVGEALAEAGIPLEGLDYSLPSEFDPVPADGQIRVVRVQESILLVQKSIPFETEFQASADVELDRQQVLQAGEPGLSVARVRIRDEDGEEVGQETEDEIVVRPPKKRIIGYGTKVVVRTAVVDGQTIEYWRAVQVYATSYSPCRSAADRCYYGTASGKPVQKGVVAVTARWYAYMQGQPVYIPGYGYATIEDVGGGIPGKPWIDLGYSDEDWVEWGDWVTVYFLTPVPANILYVLE